MRLSKWPAIIVFRRWPVALAGATLLALLGACTLLLDRNATECTTDSDCVRFGVQPSCQNGACVDTGIQCFVGVPANAANFLNQCSTAACLPFDDCARLDLCGDGGLPDAIAPPDQTPAVSALPEAGATPLCTSLPPGPGGFVYVTGSSNFPTLLANVAPYIVAGLPPYQLGPAIIYQTTSSCTGAASIFTDAGTISDPPDGGTHYAQYYGADGGAVQCLLGPGGHSVDVGESDVYSTTCNPAYDTANGTYTDRPGPVQGMAFVVNAASTQASISQAAAYEVFGLAGNGQTGIPWTVPNRYYIRNKGTGTQQMIGLAIGVPADQFWGVDQGSAQNVHDQLAGLSSDEAEQAIGIISVDVYDSDRTNLKVLAYRAAGQECGYLPDSTPASFDKQNVRDGHYPIWGPLHFFTSKPSDAALAFEYFFAGESVNPAVLDAFISASLIPNCAMAVSRPQNEELSALVPYTPPKSCVCYFLSETQSPLPSECKGCQQDSDCPASRPVCNFNYCEVQ